MQDKASSPVDLPALRLRCLSVGARQGEQGEVFLDGWHRSVYHGGYIAGPIKGITDASEMGASKAR